MVTPPAGVLGEEPFWPLAAQEGAGPLKAD